MTPTLTWKQRRRLRKKQLQLTPLAACDAAAELAKRAGFVLMNASMKSEACYYQFPGRTGLLRIATHRKGKSRRVLGSVTFPDGDCRSDGLLHMSNERIENDVARAVGLYMLRSVAE